MKFMVLLYQDLALMPTDDVGRAKLGAAYETFTQAARSNGHLTDGMPLVPMPDHVRTVGPDGIKTGPPVSRAQSLIGYYVLDYPTIDAAVEAAKMIPVAATGSVEIVPFMEM